MAADLGVWLGDVLLKCRVYGLAAPAGEPPLQQAQLSVVGTDAALGIPVLQGDAGSAGAAAAPFDWQQPQLDSAADLPDTYGTDDAGKAFLIADGTGTADIAYWDGTAWQYFVDAFGPGTPGVTPAITMDGELVDADSEFAVVVTGTDEAPHFHLQIPATPGPEGPSGPWELYDAGTVAAAGDLPVWDTTAAVYVPTTALDLPRPRRYTQPESQFTAYSGSNSSQLISTMTLPALDHAYQVDVSGHVRVGQVDSSSTAQVAVVVRLGDATTGQIVAKGIAVTSGPCIIGPHYSSQASGQTGYASSPDGALGRVPAASSATLYITAVRESGTGAWFANQVDAQLAVTVLPAAG
ncbi:MAG: hypothetical protein QM662_17935 [Gordonia sp. (in: high G+C Gram-positive bacteria)]